MNPEAAAAVARVLAPLPDGSHWIGEGPRVAEFEHAFGVTIGVPGEQVVATNSGTAAIELALRVLCVGNE